MWCGGFKPSTPLGRGLQQPVVLVSSLDPCTLMYVRRPDALGPAVSNQ